jgi:hypothetical protein
MTSPYRLQGALDRIHRAEKHLAELEREIVAFGQRDHDSCSVGLHPHFPNAFTCQRKGPPYEGIPSIISILVGEAIYNLRAALDYLAFELARVDSGNVQESTQFLICDSQKDFTKEHPKRLKGVNAAHVAFIEGLQPYNGVKWAGRLRQLSNPDKHRHLTQTSSGSGAQILPMSVVYPRIDWPIGHHEFWSQHRTKRQDGIEVDVQLITSMSISVPIKEIATRMGGNPVVLGLPLEEILHEIYAGVRGAIECFKFAP